jgi:nucleoside-diphosphate-sugar epimerase
MVVKRSGLNWIIIRPTMVYGPGEIKNKAKMFKLMQKGYFFIIGNGKNLMSLVYVDNLVKGIVLAGESKKAVNQTYILSDRRTYTMNEFVRTIARHEGIRMPVHLPVFVAYIGAFFFRILGILGVPRLLSKERIKNLTTGRSFDISKAVKELGYNPKVGLNEGVRRTVEWYKEKGILK